MAMHMHSYVAHGHAWHAWDGGECVVVGMGMRACNPPLASPCPLSFSFSLLLLLLSLSPCNTCIALPLPSPFQHLSFHFNRSLPSSHLQAFQVCKILAFGRTAALGFGALCRKPFSEFVCRVMAMWVCCC